MACAAGEAKGQKPAPSYVGLRRSSYGLRAKNGDDKWWVERAKEHPHFRCLLWVDFTANKVRSR
jgi:hypothetical protein